MQYPYGYRLAEYISFAMSSGEKGVISQGIDQHIEFPVLSLIWKTETSKLLYCLINGVKYRVWVIGKTFAMGTFSILPYTFKRIQWALSPSRSQLKKTNKQKQNNSFDKH